MSGPQTMLAHRKKILVALSGGVDSSTAAALLVKQGHYVEGATMLFRGVLKEDLLYAQKASRKLGIKYRTFDFRRKFNETIVADFISEYKRGRTPNPCVLCNKLFKFGFFLKKALALGFDMIATGHYAEVKKMNNKYLLKQGIDKNEQSYFLYRLGQEQLSRIILPLGIYSKNKVRKIAATLRLATASREKSQDICFLPNKDCASFLRKRVSPEPGNIIDKHGAVKGKHEGIVFYTYGQRKGLGISHKRPYYVTKIDPAGNIIEVGEKEDAYGKKLVAADINIIASEKLTVKTKVLAKVRYFAPLASATIEPLDKGTRVKVIFDKPQWALTPGQSVVFYKNKFVLGGGIIEGIIN